jgi:hypothetical protein
MPIVKIDGVGSENFSYKPSWRNRDFDESRYLMLAARFNGLNSTIRRINIEEEYLKYELSVLIAALKEREELGFATIGREEKECFFCKTQILIAAKVCRHCSRVQPESFASVAQFEKDVSAMIVRISAQSTVEISYEDNRCAFCLVYLKPKTLVCPRCNKPHPDQARTVAKQDVDALRIMATAFNQDVSL